MRPSASIAALILLLALGCPPFAQAGPPPRVQDAELARAFLSAAKAQDSSAVYGMLDEDASIRFRTLSGKLTDAVGAPFVVGYVVGIFDNLGLTIEGAVDVGGETLRYRLRPAKGEPSYFIDLQVHDSHVTGVVIDIQATEAHRWQPTAAAADVHAPTNLL